MVTLSTRSGLTPADSSVALAAITCSWLADVFFRAPPKVPNGVRLAPTIKIPFFRKQNKTLEAYLVCCYTHWYMRITDSHAHTHSHTIKLRRYWTLYFGHERAPHLTGNKITKNSKCNIKIQIIRHIHTISFNRHRVLKGLEYKTDCTQLYSAIDKHFSEPTIF